VAVMVGCQFISGLNSLTPGLGGSPCSAACTGPCQVCQDGICSTLDAGSQGGCPADQTCNAEGACAAP
jgi:hypothetical protein